VEPEADLVFLCVDGKNIFGAGSNLACKNMMGFVKIM